MYQISGLVHQITLGKPKSADRLYGIFYNCMDKQNKLKELQENLAIDLVHLEENNSLSEQQMDSITDAYSKVYDIVTELNKS